MGQAAWSNSPWVSVAAQVYSVDRSDVTYYGWYDSITVPGRRETGVMLGFKVGGTPGIVAGAAAAVIGLVAATNHPVYNPTATPLGP